MLTSQSEDAGYKDINVTEILHKQLMNQLNFTLLVWNQIFFNTHYKFLPKYVI